MNREAAGIVVARVLRRELVDVGGVPNVTDAEKVRCPTSSRVMLDKPSGAF